MTMQKWLAGIDKWGIARFSIECRETKTRAITMANHNKRKQYNEPMRTRSKYT